MPQHHHESPSNSLFFSKTSFKFHKIRRRKRQSMAKTKPKKKKTFMTSLLFKPTQFLCYNPPLATWPWPSCKHPKTSSFRNSHVGDSVYKTVNTVFDAISIDSPEVELHASSNVDLRSIRSDRLFFEPSSSTSGSIIQKSPKKMHPNKNVGPLKESIVLTVDSADPYRDFRESMQEMVAAHNIKDWDGLENLLGMYLRLNAKSTHGLIVGSFVDLLVAMAANSAASPSSCSCITFDEIGEMVEQFG